MESIGEDGIVVPLSEGDVCGEELLTWCLEHSSVNKDGKKIRLPGQRLLSTRLVQCLTNVEVFSLRAADIEEVTSLFSRFLRNPRVQGAIRRLEMSLRRLDVEQWMSHRHLPEELRRPVRQAERHIHAATRGDIRRHLFMFIKKVSLKKCMAQLVSCTHINWRKTISFNMLRITEYWTADKLSCYAKKLAFSFS